MSAPGGPWDGDVVVVGGGIAGCALAATLARAGVDVLVLEREARYRDRVRGEIFVSWGVAELRRMGLEDALLATPGGSYTTHGALFDEIAGDRAAAADAASLAEILPGIPGHLAVGHAEACDALARAARERGATVVTGAGGIELSTAGGTEVRFVLDGRARVARPRIVVGADGRGSVVRRRFGIPLRVSRSGTTGSGLLVRDAGDWPLHELAIGTEGDVHFQIFPRGDGHIRLYLFHRGRASRFTGPDGGARFLQCFELASVPGSARLSQAARAGPCRSYAMSDSWTERPWGRGAVLVGDAAGWSDPIIGQGLSIAVRDARIVAEALLATDEWSAPTCFGAYTEERVERMRRLRMSAELRTAMHCTFTPEGVARRRRWYELWHDEPVLGGLELAAFLGPERAPEAAFTRESLGRALALAG
jgi:2-polyprenyl-6-methoxyphenol hydroxylase-like FAD-dependent oxidoreductase